MKLLSVVIPVKDERDNIRPLVERLRSSLADLPWEVVFVDDGSRDDTFAVLEDMGRADPRVKVVRLRRNFGQTAALSAGFDASRGKYVVTMDGDLQNDPEDIPTILALLGQPADPGHELPSLTSELVPPVLAANPAWLWNQLRMEVAWIAGDDKLVWSRTTNTIQRFDLATDPHERHALPVDAAAFDALRDALERAR